jgi:hypothetical protein
MELTLQYLKDNLKVLSLQEKQQIITTLSDVEKEEFKTFLKEGLRAPLPEEVLDPKFDLKLARSQNTRNMNLARTFKQRQNYSKKAMQTMGQEGLSARSKKIKQNLGVEGRKKLAKKRVETIGEKGFVKIGEKISETLKLQGDLPSLRAIKRHEKLGVEGRKQLAQKRIQTLGKEGLKKAAQKSANTTMQKQLAKLNDEEKVFYMSTECPFCKTDISYRAPVKRLSHIRKCKISHSVISEAKAQGIVLKRSHYNNGKISKQFFPGSEPEGFVPGRLPLKKK